MGVDAGTQTTGSGLASREEFVSKKKKQKRYTFEEALDYLICKVEKATGQKVLSRRDFIAKSGRPKRVPDPWPKPSWTADSPEYVSDVRRSRAEITKDNKLVSQRTDWMTLVSDPNDPVERERAYRYVNGWSS
jgi:hypothetical protein